MKVYAQQHGKYIGVEPARPDVVYADRSAAAAWEEIALVNVGDDWFVATFTAAQRVLSMQPDGSLQTRPAGTQGEYELFRATTQPDGMSILYRPSGGIVLSAPLVLQEAA